MRSRNCCRIAGNRLSCARWDARTVTFRRWFAQLELREVIEQIAEDIERIPREYCGVGGEFDEQIEQAYPCN